MAVGGGGTRHFKTDRVNMTSTLLGLDGKTATADLVNLAARQQAAQREDFGITLKVGNLADVDTILEEWVLVMQHTVACE